MSGKNCRRSRRELVRASFEGLERRSLFSVSFGSPISSPVGSSSVFAVGDFNGDKIPDVVAKGVDGLLHFYAGTGKGTFVPGAVATSTGVTAGTPVLSIVAADVNKDGKLDLVVLDGATGNTSTGGTVSAGTVAVLMGKGNGTFGSPVYYGAGPTPEGLAVVDENGDGWPDVVVADAGVWSGTSTTASGNGAALLLGSATGLKAATRISLPGPQTAVAGATGASVTSTAAAPAMTLTFAGPSQSNSTTGASQTSLMLVSGGTSSAGSSGVGAGSSGSASLIGVFTVPGANRGVAVGSLTPDGRLDAVAVQASAAASTTAAGGVQVYTIASKTAAAVTGTTASYAVSGPFATGFTAVTSVAAADLNGDGVSDVVVAGSYPKVGTNASTVSSVGTALQGGVSVLLGTSAGKLGTAAVFATANVPLGLSLADLNGDGVLDIVVSDGKGLEALLGIRSTTSAGVK